MALPSIVDSGLSEAGTAVAVIVHPERGLGAIFEYVNEPFAAAMRQPETGLTGATAQTFIDLVAEADLRDQLAQSLQSGKSVQLDLPLLFGGVRRWFGLRLSFPKPGVSGVRNAILIGRDITESRHNATQDDKTRQLLAQIFMRINVAAFIVARGGELVMSNAAFRQLSGFSVEASKRLRAPDLFPEEFAQAFDAAHARQFTDSLTYELDCEMVGNDLVRVPVHKTSILLSGSDQPYRLVTMLPRPAQTDAPKASSNVAWANVLAANTIPDSGDLRVISLEAIRSLFGADWERIAVRAMLRAEHTIRKRLKREDVIIRTRDDKFVIWFSGEDRSGNGAVLDAIVREIRLTLLTEFGEEASTHVDAA